MDGNQGDEGEGIDRHEPSAPAASASQMSPSEFVLAARRRKGLDPTRLTDQPDTADEQGQLGQPSAAAGHTDGSAFAGQVRVPWEVPYKWSLGSVRVGPMEPGVAALVDALSGLDAPKEVDDQCLHERTIDLVRARSLLDAAINSHLGEWDRRGGWANDGSKSPTARLARDANCSRASAGAAVKLSRALARMPRTGEALSDGRISLDHARRLVEACTDERLELFLEAEEHLLADAVRLAGDHRGFSRVVSYWELITDDKLHDPKDPTAEPPGAKRQRLGRDFRMPTTVDGFDLTGSLGTADGAIVWNQIQHIYDELWKADWEAARAEHGDETCVAHMSRTVAQRRADALVEMAKRASGHRPGDAVARPLVSVLVHAEDLFGPLRQTFNGVVLSRRDVAEWLTEADFERIVFGPEGKPVDITSPGRFFTGAMRRAVQIRDQVCAHPTCDVDAERCQVDHVVEHTAGGPTNLDNARLLCPRHNQQRPGRGKKPPAADDDGDGDGDGDHDGDGKRE